jgi:hypothetical protein
MRITALSLVLLQAFASTSTIQFNHNEVVADGPIYAGSNVTIKYDIGRAKCPLGEYAGFPTRYIMLGYSLNGHPQEYKYIHAGRDPIATEPVLTEVPKGDLALWVRCSSRAATTYDSNDSQNFHFLVVDMPVIQFKAGYTQQVINGPLKTSGSVKVEYDPVRSPCREVTQDGIQTKKVSLNYVLNNGPIKQLPIFYQDSGMIQPKLETPVIEKLSKGKLSIWFTCTSQADKVGYDSNYSQNYNFEIQ